MTNDADNPGQFAYLVIYDRSGLAWAGFDPERADELARNTGSVVVQLPILADYRPAPTGTLDPKE